jgi:hypothetical protein
MKYQLHKRRVQVQLTKEQIDALRRLGAARGEGISPLVRQAVDHLIRAEERAAVVEQALAAIGGFHSGLGDLAERHDDYLDEDAP